MMKKDTFVKIMDSVRDYWNNLRKLEDVLGVYFEEGFLVKMVDNTLDALCDEMESDLDNYDEYEPWVYYYAFELDFGRNNKARDGVTFDGNTVPLTNAEQLYDFLVELNKCKN